MNDKQFSEAALVAAYRFDSSERVLVDVGAHHGSFLMPFARKGWRVIAFEPERQNWKALLQNTTDYPNITCVNKAVSDMNAQDVLFYVSDVHYGIHSLRPFHDTHRAAYSVTTVRLTDALEEQGITAVTCLKIDIEGADFLALRGFDIDKFQPELVLMEFMDSRSMRNFGYDHHDVVRYMQERGYSAFVSEWAPIREYGREGVAGTAHAWLRCQAYPLDAQPAWGNLIFVSINNREKLALSIEEYLQTVSNPRWRVLRRLGVKEIIGLIPGARFVYRKIRNWVS